MICANDSILEVWAMPKKHRNRPGVLAAIIGAGGVVAAALITAIATLMISHGAASSSATTPSVIRITSPATGTMVHTGAISVEGTTTQPLTTGHEIWIVVQPQGTGRYYPQWPPAADAASGDWTVPTVVLGGIDSFLVDVVDANPSVIAAFEAYLQQNQHSFPGMASLPAGAQIADSVTIARQ